MVFSSLIFLFLFLPIVLAGYYLLPRVLKNIFLFLVSLIFYAFGDAGSVYLILLSVLVNYSIGRLIETKEKYARVLLFIGVVFNLSVLVFYKYGRFAGIPWFNSHSVILPLGISFFTFHALSFITDVYRKTSLVPKNPMDVGLYIVFFPQLIAGPILRYHDIADQIRQREFSFDQFAKGVRRFVFGLGKKVLIANTLAVVADKIMDSDYRQINTPIAWLGIICYTLQIFFDFSGYSDMAIGLGRMFGFELIENFNFPYASTSVRQFWKCWHISLSTWFRDYLYIPLGGNKKGRNRTYINLLVVFFLCGLWHGASWNFVLWGIYYGIFLILERGQFGALLARLPALFRHIYLLLIVIVGWVFFRIEQLHSAVIYLKQLFFVGQGSGDLQYSLGVYFSPFFFFILITGILFSFRFPDRLRQIVYFNSSETIPWLFQLKNALEFSVVFLILLVSSAFLAKGGYNPFIYFRF